jgi:hypothetical protein
MKKMTKKFLIMFLNPNLSFITEATMSVRSLATGSGVEAKHTIRFTNGQDIRRGRKFSSLPLGIFKKFVDPGNAGHPSDARETYLFFIVDMNPEWPGNGHGGGKNAVEADVSPVCKVTSMGCWSRDARSKGALPLHMFDPSDQTQDVRDFLSTYPNLWDWIYTRVRYPHLDRSTNLLEPGRGGILRNVKGIGKFEVFVGTLYGTINDFYQTGNTTSLKYALWLLRSMRIQLKMDEFEAKSQVELLEDAEKLEVLIRNRDESIGDAKKFIEFKESLHPAHYFYCLYNCAFSHNRSDQAGLHNFLFGLLTQHLMGENGVTAEGLSDHFLRMVIERESKFVPNINVSECRSMDEIIQKVHQRIGRKVVENIAEWGFMIEFVKCVQSPMYCNTSYTWFELSMKQISAFRDHYRGIRSIASSFLSVSSCQISDAAIANAFMVATKNRGKMLDCVFLDPDSVPFELQQILDKNLEKSVRDQNTLKRLETEEISLPNCPKFSRGFPYELFKIICVVCQRDDTLSIKTLLKGIKTGGMSRKRFFSQVARFCVIGGNIHKKYSDIIGHFLSSGIRNKCNLHRKRFPQILAEIEARSVSGGKSEIEDTFVPYPRDEAVYESAKVAKKLVDDIHAKIAEEEEEALRTCAICFECYGSDVIRSVLHVTKSIEHVTCESCREGLGGMCPFCRFEYE